MTSCKVTFLIVAVVAIFSIPTTESQSPTKTLSLTPKRYPQPSGSIGLPAGTPFQPKRFHHFDLDLLKAAAEQIPGNFMISPASIKSTLGMLLEAADGSAATELRQALRLTKDTNAQRELFKNFLTSTNLRSDGVDLRSANRIFLNNQLTPNPKYQEVLRNYYQSDIFPINFIDQQEAVSLINYWIEQATSNKITNFISNGDFDPTTIMIMANALYFKGNWKVAFDAAATRARCFYTAENECRNVHMMEMQADFNFGYIEALNSNAIEIPYKGDNYSMLIILPKEQGDINSLVKDLNHVSFKDILNQMSDSEVQLSLPRFQIDYESELIPLLKKVGISEVFVPNANLSKIVIGGSQNPQVNSVIHKTHIEVNEKGAEAAAVTGAVVIPLMGTSLDILNLNHPFLFFIRDKTTGAILFGGRVNEPTPYQNNRQTVQGQTPRPRTTLLPASGRPNIRNPGIEVQTPSPYYGQNIPSINSGLNQQGQPKNVITWNEQQSAGKSNTPSNSLNRRADGSHISNIGESQQVIFTPSYSSRSYEITTLPPQNQQFQYKQEQTPQSQDYKITIVEDKPWRQNENQQSEQNGWGEYRENQETVYGQGNKRNEEKQEYALLKGKAYPSQTHAQVTNGNSRSTLGSRIRRQKLDCTTTHCEMKNLPINEAELRQYREQELKQHQEKLISEENVRQHLEYELKQKQEQELNQQQQQLLSEQIYRQHQEEEARQKEINAENFRKSQELQQRQADAQKLNQEERDRQELKIKQELEDLAVKQHDEELRHQEAQAELFRQNEEYEFQRKIAEEKLLNQQRSQELKELRAQSLDEHNFRQQLEQEVKQKQEQERNLQQRQEEELRLKHQQEQLILEQHLRLQNETQQKEQLTQEENFRIQQEEQLKQENEQELRNQADKLQHEQNLRQLQEAEQRQTEAQTELLRQIQEIELRQKEAQELKLSKIQGHQQEQFSLPEHQQIVQNPHLSGPNPGQYTAFNPGQSSSNNPVQYSNPNLGQKSDFVQHQEQQYQQQHSFGRRA